MAHDPTRETAFALAWRLAALIGIVLVLGAVLARDTVRYGPSEPLLVPVFGVERHELVDSFGDPRDEDRLHEAIDIPAPRGTPVVAAAPGRVQSVFRSSRGGLSVYQIDRTETWCLYYGHLDRFADGLEAGQYLNTGDAIGTVGTSGNAPDDVPHLHFAVLTLGDTMRCSDGRAVNPFALFR
jgi:murein DD-endopeptidase MepM/ murein hydrolase activator NlpD